MYTPVPAAGRHCSPMIDFQDVDDVLMQPARTRKPANPITPGRKGATLVSSLVAEDKDTYLTRERRLVPPSIVAWPQPEENQAASYLQVSSS
jgi:hypothetical protein